MTTMGWIFVGILSFTGIYFITQLVRDILWNRKLYVFQKSVGSAITKAPVLFWVKRSYGAVIAGLFVLTTVFSGVFQEPYTLNDRTLLNAKPVGNLQTMQSLIENSQQGYWNDWFFRGDLAIPEAMEDATAGADDESNGANRDYIDTNVQVEGVQEGDIVKTDGYHIYYASRYYNSLRVLSVDDFGMVTVEAEIDMGNLYTDQIYITDTQLIVIGYVYEMIPYVYEDGKDYYGWAYTSFSGAVYIYNRETLELEYSLETDGNFYEHRLINNALFLIANKSIYGDDLRPVFEETEGDVTETSTLDYRDIYYFDDIPVYGMTVFTGINLTDYTMSSEAFLGYVSEIYANTEALYTAFNYTDYTPEDDEVTDNFWYQSKVQIMKFDLDTEHATIHYAGQQVLPGYVGDQYWMDEHEGYFRVVTSSWNPILNQLFILKEDNDTDTLDLVGSITEDLGKVNETVKTVRFNGDLGYVVTFEQKDPLYTIDLSDPTDPTILSAIEEPGYSTYLHVWNDEGDQLIGFGFSADEQGFVTGLKISAYDTALTEPLATYQLNGEDPFGVWSYSYSEAAYNPKAMMISPDHGIIAFPVMTWRSMQVSPLEWDYSYISQYMVFYIDFTAENPEDIISDPIIISHAENSWYAGIDRGVYINNVVYTLSYTGMVSFDLESKEVLQTIHFSIPEFNE